MVNANQVDSKIENGYVYLKALTANEVGGRIGPNCQHQYLLIRVDISVLEAWDTNAYVLDVCLTWIPMRIHHRRKLVLLNKLLLRLTGLFVIALLPRTFSPP